MTTQHHIDTIAALELTILWFWDEFDKEADPLEYARQRDQLDAE